MTRRLKLGEQPEPIFDPPSPIGAEVFTHITPAGTVRHFSIDKLKELIVALVARYGYANVIRSAMIPEDQVTFIRQHRGIEQEKLDRLCEPWLSQPVILCEIPDENGVDRHLVTVDGHHRIVRCFDDGRKSVAAALLPEVVWSLALVDVVTDKTPEELISHSDDHKARAALGMK